MKIKKVLNNNAVIALNSKEKDVVITGLGLAFKKKSGDIIDENKIERVFKIEDKEYSKVQRAVENISIEYLGIAEDILVLAEDTLNLELNKSAIFVLADHISFAIERFKNCIDLKNPLEWEVKQYYSDEYEIGNEALKIIDDVVGVELPEDEAASIALHLVNAREPSSISDVVQIVNVLQETINIIKYNFLKDFDEDDYSYQRLVNHLKFFAQSVVTKKNIVDEDDLLYDIVKDKYVQAFECAVKICEYAKERYGYDVSNSEMTFLTVHMHKALKL